MLASTFSDIEKLAWSCPHPKGTHQQIAGALSPEGHFLSRDTAQYPPLLAAKFAELILPLLTTNGTSIALSHLDQYLPVKSLADPPFPRQDGGGFASKADWSAQHSYEDCFKTLRQIFFSHIMDNRLDKVILSLLPPDRSFLRFRWNNSRHLEVFWMNSLWPKAMCRTGPFLKIRTLPCSFCSVYVSAWRTQTPNCFLI